MTPPRTRSAVRRVLHKISQPFAGPDEPSFQPSPEETLMTPQERAVVDRVSPISITSTARVLTLMDAVRYCVERPIAGAFAECGVWRGGSVLAMILTLQDLGCEDRDIYLYDTFEGMTRPTALDTSRVDQSALETWNEAQSKSERPWAQYFSDDEMISEDTVRSNLAATGYPESRLHFIRGPVEETLPEHAPESLALLRLDTDWYESTRHELVHLYPRLANGGVLIVDDYGHWEGAKRAVDEYFSTLADPVLLSRVDYTGRMAVKV